MDRDLLVIGGGPGGYVAAIRGAQLGKKVILIEEDKIGGTCLNRGCIPTKALYKNAEVINTLNNINSFGITVSDYTVDMIKVQQRKQEIVDKLKTGIEQLLKGNNIEVIKGSASFTGNKNVEVKDLDGNKTNYTAENIIIATGSVDREVLVPGADLERVITSNEALELDHIPKKVVIYGGGVVGVEFASILSSLGAEVTIIKYTPRLLSKFDEEIARRLAMYIKKKGIKLVTGVNLTEIQSFDDGLKVIVTNDKGENSEFICDYLLSSAGRKPNINGLNLEVENIEYDKKGIKVNESYETSSKNIYAIGDVIGGNMLAHLASEEGKICVENICGIESRVNYDAVPSCVFCFPEVSTVGLTEEEVKERGYDYIVGKTMFGANGKALTMGEGDGNIKIIADNNTHKILGVHIIGPHASDIIHEGVLAIENGLKIENIVKSIHAHPTLSEAFVEAVSGCLGEAIHSMPSKKVNK